MVLIVTVIVHLPCLNPKVARIHQIPFIVDILHPNSPCRAYFRDKIDSMHTTYVVCGSPGAGKSTYARKLASARHAALLDIDTVTERLARLALREAGHDPDDRDSDYFKRTFREPVYETLFDIARENLPYQEVVVVGPFTRELRDPDWPAKLARVLGGPAEVHYVSCPPEIRRKRLAERGDARDLAKLRDWEGYVRYYEESPPVFEHLSIDGASPDGLD
jgi:predicted kinase